MFPNDDKKVDWDNPLLAYKATSDPDPHYYHQAMKEQDKEEFENSMMREVEDQYNNGNFLIVHKSKVPDDLYYPPFGKCGGRDSQGRVLQLKSTRRG